MTQEALKLALEALMRSRKAVSGNLDLAGCAYGKNDLDGHRYSDAKKALVTLDKAITAIKEALAQEQDSTCSITLRLQGKPYPRTCKKCGLGPCIAQPAVQTQEPSNRTTPYSTTLSSLLNSPAHQNAMAQQEQEPVAKYSDIVSDGGLDPRNKFNIPPQRTEQEPVAWRTFDGEGGYDYCSYEDNESYADDWNKRNPNHVGWVDKLYTHAPQRTWVGLTEDDKVLINHDANFNQFMTAGEYADRVQQLTEAKLKEKNT